MDEKVLNEILNYDEDLNQSLDSNTFNVEYLNFLEESLGNINEQSINDIYQTLDNSIEALGLGEVAATVDITDIQNKEYEALVNQNEASVAMKNIEHILENIMKDPSLSEEEKQEKQQLLSAVISVANDDNASAKSIQQAKVVFEEHINDKDNEYKYSDLVKDVRTIREEDLEAAKQKEMDSMDMS